MDLSKLLLYLPNWGENKIIFGNYKSTCSTRKYQSAIRKSIGNDHDTLIEIQMDWLVENIFSQTKIISMNIEKESKPIEGQYKFHVNVQKNRSIPLMMVLGDVIQPSFFGKTVKNGLYFVNV